MNKNKVNLLLDRERDLAYIVCPECGQLTFYVQGTAYHNYFPCGNCKFSIKSQNNS